MNMHSFNDYLMRVQNKKGMRIITIVGISLNVSSLSRGHNLRSWAAYLEDENPAGQNKIKNQS